MLEVNIEPKYLLPSSRSLGTQRKYFKNNTYYKINKTGNESVSEHLVSLLLDCTDIKHVNYVECVINGKPGCYSFNFLKKNQKLVTLTNLYSGIKLSDLNTVLRTFNTIEERYDYVIDFVRSSTGLNIGYYLDMLLCLDFITLNPDRHFDNIALMYDGEWQLAPIFDNGQSLGANWNITPPGEFIESSLFAATLSGSFNEQLRVTKNKLKINYTALFYKLKECRDTRNKQILIDRLVRYESLFKYC